MSGDLGNLLTGELGEAEARFSHEDFAGEFGRRVAGRVRRRRAVRAAGVGGGTMLTAGALAVGATHMPWGVLDAAPGVGGSDCVTPSPTDGASLVTVTFDGSDGRLAETVVTDPATGGVRLRGIQQADGTWLVTDADGNSVEATPGPDGGYVVNFDGATLAIEWPDTGASALPSDPAADGSFTYSVESPDAAVSPGGSNDCFTPSPTESASATGSADPSASPGPSLAAKPEDVVAGENPFDCGFVFPTESFGTDSLWIEPATWVDRADAAAAILAPYSEDPSLAPDVAGITDPVSVMAVHFAGAYSSDSMSATLGTDAPSVGDVSQILAPVTNARTDTVASEGATFVGVTDGVVVATFPARSGDLEAASSVYVDWRAPEEGSLMYLLDQGAALTSCDASSVDMSRVGVVAVAGLVVQRTYESVDGPTYAWMPVGKP